MTCSCIWRWCMCVVGTGYADCESAELAVEGCCCSFVHHWFWELQSEAVLAWHLQLQVTLRGWGDREREREGVKGRGREGARERERERPYLWYFQFHLTHSADTRQCCPHPHLPLPSLLHHTHAVLRHTHTPSTTIPGLLWPQLLDKLLSFARSYLRLCPFLCSITCLDAACLSSLWKQL